MNIRKSITFAVVAASLTLSAMAVPTLTVTKGDGSINVSVPAGAADAESKLYLVWDTEDHGDELAAWPSENYIRRDDDLSAGGTYTFSTNSLPENYCARAIVAKTVNVVDSIRLGQNSSYVDTGISATSVYGIDIKYRRSDEQLLTDELSYALISGKMDDGTIAHWKGANLYMRWNGVDYGYIFQNILSTTDVKEIAVTNGIASINGEGCSFQKNNGPISGAMGTVDKTVLLSAAWNGSSVERYMDAYWYAATLFGADGSALVDLVPAKVDDTPKFYDKVSNTYIAITGNATASGDVVETKYTLASSAVMSSVTSAEWTGGGETALLSDAGNWTPGLPGAFSDSVTINASNAKPAVVPSGTTAYGKFLVGYKGEGNLTQSQGTITASAINGVVIGAINGGIGTYTMTGGTLTTTFGTRGNDTEDDALYVGSGGGTGFFNVGGDAHVELNHRLNLGLGDNSKGYLTLSDNAEVKCYGDISVGTWTGNCYGEVTQKGGTLSAIDACVRIPFMNEGKYTLTDGNLIVTGQSPTNDDPQRGGIFIGGYGSGGHGQLEQSGGEISIAQDLYIGGFQSDYPGTGDVVIKGGKMTVGRYFMIGAYTRGTFNQSGGEVVCNTWTAIGRFSGKDGYCTVTGGTLTTPGLNIGEDGIGTLTVSDNGTVKTTGQYGITLGAKSGSAGTLKLQAGGKIVTEIIKKGSGAATLVEFNGGTIQATTADANILEGLGNIVLKSGGVTIDTQEKNLVIKDCTFNVEPGGKITVTGGGTVTFTNCKVRYTGSLTGAVVFAETDGVFSTLPIFDGTKEMRLSEDKKTIKIVPRGFIILFR